MKQKAAVGYVGLDSGKTGTYSDDSIICWGKPFIKKKHG
jgi:hypothetical protein